jgi:DNA-binding GntR family transcriptional regulator
MDGSAAASANRAFHETIVMRGDNPLLVEQTREAWDRLDAIQRSGFNVVRYLPQRGWEALDEHEALLQLIERDPHDRAEIERAARKHRERTIKYYERELRMARTG